MLLLLLLHGPPGSGKSSVGSALRDVVRSISDDDKVSASAGREVHVECVELDDCIKTVESTISPPQAGGGEVSPTFSPEVWSAAWSTFRNVVAHQCAELGAAANEHDGVTHILVAIDTMHYASMRANLLRQVNETCDSASAGLSERILLQQILVWPETVECCMARNALRSGKERIPDEVVARSFRAEEKEISPALLRRINGEGGEPNALLLQDPVRRHRGLLRSLRAPAPELARELLSRILALRYSPTTASSSNPDADAVTLSSLCRPKCPISCGACRSPAVESVDHMYDMLLRRAVQQHMQQVLASGGMCVKQQSKACVEVRRRLLRSFEAKGAFRGLVCETSGSRSETEDLVDALFQRVLLAVNANAKDVIC